MLVWLVVNKLDWVLVVVFYLVGLTAALEIRSVKERDIEAKTLSRLLDDIKLYQSVPHLEEIELIL